MGISWNWKLFFPTIIITMIFCVVFDEQIQQMPDISPSNLIKKILEGDSYAVKSKIGHTFYFKKENIHCVDATYSMQEIHNGEAVYEFSCKAGVIEKNLLNNRVSRILVSKCPSNKVVCSAAKHFNLIP